MQLCVCMASNEICCCSHFLAVLSHAVGNSWQYPGKRRGKHDKTFRIWQHHQISQPLCRGSDSAFTCQQEELTALSDGARVQRGKRNMNSVQPYCCPCWRPSPDSTGRDGAGGRQQDQECSQQCCHCPMVEPLCCSSSQPRDLLALLMAMSFVSSGPEDCAGRAGLGRRHGAVTQLPSNVRFLPLHKLQAQKYECVFLRVDTMDQLCHLKFLNSGEPLLRSILSHKSQL